MSRVSHWNNYIEYLKDWATQHIEEENEGMSPACYEEFLDNEYEEEEEEEESMTREEFLTAVDELYKAVRDSVGYNDHADKLIDQLEEMADAWEREHEELKEIK